MVCREVWEGNTTMDKVYLIWEYNYSMGPWDIQLVDIYKNEEDAHIAADKLNAACSGEALADDYAPYAGTEYKVAGVTLK